MYILENNLFSFMPLVGMQQLNKMRNVYHYMSLGREHTCASQNTTLDAWYAFMMGI